jgi:hypothetical protein
VRLETRFPRLGPDRVAYQTLARGAGAGQRPGQLRPRRRRGIGVHIAARVMAAAGPREILLSRTVHDLVAGSAIRLRDRGTHRLNGVQGDGSCWRWPPLTRRGAGGCVPQGSMARRHSRSTLGRRRASSGPNAWRSPATAATNSASASSRRSVPSITQIQLPQGGRRFTSARPATNHIRLRRAQARRVRIGTEESGRKAERCMVPPRQLTRPHRDAPSVDAEPLARPVACGGPYSASLQGTGRASAR